MVIDASAAVVLFAGTLRERLALQQRIGGAAVHVPHLVDPEVASALRSNLRRGHLTVVQCEAALAALGSAPFVRHPHAPLLLRMWELRDDVTPYDACYVALAEALGMTLLTADLRLGNAPGPRCPVELV